MHRLLQLSKPSRALVLTQLLQFKAKCESESIKFVFIHKFLVKIITKSDVAYLKINLLDMEFIFVSKKHKMLSFTSLPMFTDWFMNHYFEEEKNNES